MRLSLFPQLRRTVRTNYLYTDASLRGCGGYYLSTQQQALRTLQPASAFALHWRSAHHCGEIARLELLPVLHALHRWAGTFRGGELHVFSDNEEAVSGLQTGRAKRAEVAEVVAAIADAAERERVTLVPALVRGADNTLADALSRGCRERVVRLAPGLGKVFAKGKGLGFFDPSYPPLKR
ncbi:hypothetical protein FN846DRAFT_961904 [Sphaerosporella brunnea]|uniref:RNase H type-1 domain-containing protein n=1 Tax=Sphaerosporella brunnea TaxID=1250544 RepID=A0A5J5EPD0_9PEZI|nr:hypothetical protein FN846DRAFT_961904 [Sphaerosporella brunnea]